VNLLLESFDNESEDDLSKGYRNLVRELKVKYPLSPKIFLSVSFENVLSLIWFQKPNY